MKLKQEPTVPLDEFQKGVIAVISRNRCPKSPFAGGAVVQQHGFRLSDDQDIFAADDEILDRLLDADRAALEATGYVVQLAKRYMGFRECRVTKATMGATVLQWTAALGREFYAPVPDSQFGYRLHLADLAVNKALAASGRTSRRDFVDLWMLDRHVMPLWRMACAGPGKDTSLNPFSLIERMSFNWSMAVRRGDPDDRLMLTTEVPLMEIGDGLFYAMSEARTLLRDVGPECYGRLQVDDSEHPVTDRKIVSGGNWMVPKPVGALPAFAGTDSEMIAG